MTIRWTPTGLRDLESLRAYIANGNPNAAAAAVDRIAAAIEELGRHPGLGRKGRVAGTRELAVAPYVIVYRNSKAAIEILTIMHGARRWPDSF